jgi:hypothetical protein
MVGKKFWKKKRIYIQSFELMWYFSKVWFQRGPPLSPWWEAHMTSNAITNTHLATPTIIIITTQRRYWPSPHQSKVINLKKKKKIVVISSLEWFMQKPWGLLGNQVGENNTRKWNIKRNLFQEHPLWWPRTTSNGI